MKLFFLQISAVVFCASFTTVAASFEDTYCFDPFGTQSGFIMSDSQRITMAKGWEIKEGSMITFPKAWVHKNLNPAAFPSTDVVPVPSDCFSDTSTGSPQLALNTAGKEFALAACKGANSEETMLKICMSICLKATSTGDFDCAGVNLKEEKKCYLYSREILNMPTCAEFPLHPSCGHLKRSGKFSFALSCDEKPLDIQKYKDATITKLDFPLLPEVVYKMGTWVDIVYTTGAGNRFVPTDCSGVSCQCDKDFTKALGEVVIANVKDASNRKFLRSVSVACGDSAAAVLSNSMRFVIWVHYSDSSKADSITGEKSPTPDEVQSMFDNAQTNGVGPAIMNALAAKFTPAATWSASLTAGVDYKFYGSTWPSSASFVPKSKFRESEITEYESCLDANGKLTGFPIADNWVGVIHKDVQWQPEDHGSTIPFFRSYVHGGDLSKDKFPIPEGCFSDVDAGTPENPALVQKGKHYELLDLDANTNCVGNRTTEEMLRICMTICSHLEYGGPGTEDQRCLGVNFDEMGYGGHCHTLTLSSSTMTYEDLACHSGSGNQDKSGMCAVEPGWTPRSMCSTEWGQAKNQLDSAVCQSDGTCVNEQGKCGMRNYIAMACHIPGMDTNQGLAPTWGTQCLTGTAWNGNRCANVPPGEYTVQTSYPFSSAVPRPADFAGLIVAGKPCPVGFVCFGGTGCRKGEDPKKCLDTCPLSPGNKLPNKMTMPGSSKCLTLCKEEGANITGTLLNGDGVLVLEAEFWREKTSDGKPMNWTVNGATQCLKPGQLWAACWTEGACVGGRGGGDDLCRTGHGGPFCEVCQSGYFQNSDGKCEPIESCSNAGVAIYLAFPFIIALIALILAGTYILYWVAEDVDSEIEAAKAVDSEAVDYRVSRQSPVFSKEGTVTTTGGRSVVDGVLVEVPGSPASLLPVEGNRVHVVELAGAKTEKTYGRCEIVLESTNTVTRQSTTVINFVQICGKFNMVFQMKLPRLSTAVLQWLNIFTFNFFSLLPFGCMWMNFGFYDYMTFVLTFVTVCNAVFLVSFAIMRWGLPDLVGRQNYMNNLTNLGSVFNYLLYVHIVGASFSAFACVDSPSSGKQYLRRDMNIDCSSDTYYDHVALAYVAIVVYVIGVPVAMIAAVRYAVTTHGPGTSRVFVLHRNYKEEWWFTEAIICLEKATLSGFLVFVPESPLQIITAILVAVLWLTFFAAASPFKFRADNHIKNVAMSMQVAVLVCILMLKIHDEDSLYDKSEVDIMLVVFILVPFMMVGILIVAMIYRATTKSVNEATTEEETQDAQYEFDSKNEAGNVYADVVASEVLSNGTLDVEVGTVSAQPDRLCC